MIVKMVDDKTTLHITTEDADDLLNLRRVLKSGYTVTGHTTRVLKRERDYSRPDRGERVRIRVSIVVGKISLDGTLERLRINGTVSESNNDSVPHGTHHSITVTVGDCIIISKEKRSGRWSPAELKILRRSAGGESGGDGSFLVVAIDSNDCGIARLRGTHLDISPNIYSGRGGKRYNTNYRIEGFFESILGGMNSMFKDGDRIILFGPGNTKRRLANYISTKPAHVQRYGSMSIVEGVDSGGEDGIYTFTRSDVMRKTIAGSKLATVSQIIDEIMERAHKKSTKYAMGYEETLTAAKMGAIDALVFADGALKEHDDEQRIIDLLNMAESGGARVYSVDSTTDMGLRTSGLGGIVALLRYAV